MRTKEQVEQYLGRLSKEELVDTIYDLVHQHFTRYKEDGTVDHSSESKVTDSGFITCNANALEILVECGRARPIQERTGRYMRVEL